MITKFSSQRLNYIYQKFHLGSQTSDRGTVPPDRL